MRVAKRSQASTSSAPAGAHGSATRLRADRPFAHVVRCLDLKRRDVEEAFQSREACRALLTQFTAIARPHTGAPLLLHLFTRLARGDCEWLDGTLRVELTGDADVTVVELLTELGAGLRERVFSPVALRVPLAEFVEATVRRPQLILPLVAKRSVRKLALRVGADASVLPEGSIAIDDDCMIQIPPPPRVPSISLDGLDELEDGWDF
jgi:hypothetical protein